MPTGHKTETETFWWEFAWLGTVRIIIEETKCHNQPVEACTNQRTIFCGRHWLGWDMLIQAGKRISVEQ